MISSTAMQKFEFARKAQGKRSIFGVAINSKRLRRNARDRFALGPGCVIENSPAEALVLQAEIRRIAGWSAGNLK